MQVWTPGFKRYLAGYALQVTAWTLAVVTAPFLALAAGESWLTAGVVLGLAPRLLVPLLGGSLSRAPAAWLAAASLLAAGACGAALLGASAASGPLALLLYLALGGSSAAEGVLAPVFVQVSVGPDDRLRANATVAALSMGLPALLAPLAGWLAEQLGTAWTLGPAAVFFLLRALSLRGLPAAGEPAGRKAQKVQREKLSDLWPYALSLLAVATALGYLQVKLPVLLQARGLGAAALGVYNGAFSAGMLSGAALAWLGARRPGAVRGLGFAAAALGLACLALPRVGVITAAAAALGFGLAGLQSLGVTILQKRLVGGVLTAVTAGLTSLTALAMVAGGLAAGSLDGVWNPGLLLGLALAAAIAAVGVLPAGRRP